MEEMTMNQVQKIRAEIERLLGQKDYGYEDEAEHGYRDCLLDLKEFIDSMQEEPSPVWHDVSEEPDEQRELLCEWDSVDATWHEVAFYHADTQDYWNYTSKVEGVTKWAYIDDLLSIKEEEPVSEDLEEEINKVAVELFDKLLPQDGDFITEVSFKECVETIARHFANWQKEQDDTIIKLAKVHYRLLGKIQMKKEFEKNRLAHCDNITFEQFKLEQEFVDSHLEKNNRIPTLLDAIEYGMKSQNEQMIQKAVEWVEENIDEYGAISSMGKDLKNYLEDNT